MPPCRNYVFLLVLAMTSLSQTLGPWVVRAAFATDSTLPGPVVWESTFQCAGFKWFIEGDDDRDCAVAVNYREGEPPGEWREAQPLLRVNPNSQNYHNISPGNLLAGSIFNLGPGVSYDVALSLSDPDGGAAAETLRVTTRTLPSAPPDARIRFVVPGAGGGSGTPEDPFLGLAAANADARPGDLFLLGPGTYTGSALLTASGTEASPIIWRGTEAGAVILDGENLSDPVVGFPGTGHVHLENVTIRRPGQNCIQGSGTVGLVIRDCFLQVPDINGPDMTAIDLRGAAHQDAVISGNTMQGPLHWEDGRIDDHYGLRIIGTGHIIHHNRIYDCWDGIQVGADDDSVDTSGCDVYGNEIYNCTDDGIETDASRQNIRVFDNRITNVLVGISCQPVYGGPIYMLRNVVYNWQLKPMKFHVWPTGLIVYNNTFFGAYPFGWYGGQWKNGRLRNNLMLGSSASGCGYDPVAVNDQAYEVDWDYDGFFQARPGRFAYFINVMYPTLSAFQFATGQEMHAVMVDSTVFAGAEEPVLGSCVGVNGYPPPYEPGSQDLTLREGSAAIDAGEALANVTDGYMNTAPDLGAYEYGGNLPQYGPAGDPLSGLTPKALVARGLRLYPAAPNPFRLSTRIRFELSRAGPVTVEVNGVAGGRVRCLLKDGWCSAGGHALRWDGRNDEGVRLSAGVYFYTVTTKGQRTAGRMVVIR